MRYRLKYHIVQVAKMLRSFTTTYNTHPLQSELTQVCALYVVYFFIRAQQGVAFGKIIGEFPHNELINDFFVIIKITVFVYAMAVGDGSMPTMQNVSI